MDFGFWIGDAILLDMMMPEQPKRRWFKFHLSSAIFMSLVAGILLWLQLQGLHGTTYYGVPIDRYSYGWPFHAYTEFNYDKYRGMKYVDVPDAIRPVTLEELLLPNVLSYPALVYDICICTMTLLISGVASEWWIRKNGKVANPKSKI